MTKAHACAYCGIATSQGPHAAFRDGRYWPPCCSSTACLGRWWTMPLSEASDETLLLLDATKHLPPSQMQEINQAAEMIAMARGLDSLPELDAN